MDAKSEHVCRLPWKTRPIIAAGRKIGMTIRSNGGALAAANRPDAAKALGVGAKGRKEG